MAATSTDWVAWGSVDVTGIALPELIADTFLVDHSGILDADKAVTGVWAKAIGWLIMVITTASMTWAVVGVAVITMESFLTLTSAIEVTLGVVVALKTAFAA